MTQKIEFTAKNVKVFSLWLKKFSTIDKGLLLEVDEPNSKFIAKTYNEERSVVKLSSIKFDVAGFVVKPSKNPKRIKVGIYNIVRLMKIMEQFGDDEFSFVINWDELKDGESSEFVGTDFILKNKNLKINIECVSLNVFKYISDDLFENTISALDNVIEKFKLNTENIEKINQLSSLDDEEYKFLTFKSGSNVYICGKTFDLLIKEISEEWNGKEDSINLFKGQFANLDVDDYDVKMGDDKIIFSSTDKFTTTVISRVEKD